MSSREYCKDLLLKNGLLYQKVLLKNHLGPISQFVPTKKFCSESFWLATMIMDIWVWRGH